VQVEEVVVYIFDHFGNVIFLVAAIGGAVKWMWSRIRGEIQSANRDVVSELKGMRVDFQHMADSQKLADDRISKLDNEVSVLKGRVDVLMAGKAV
jgi:hypothetical protein